MHLNVVIRNVEGLITFSKKNKLFHNKCQLLLIETSYVGVETVLLRVKLDFMVFIFKFNVISFELFLKSINRIKG